GNRLTRLTPFNAYKAKDGYFVIASGSNEHWMRILKAMQREDLIDDNRYRELSNRVSKADEVDSLINAWAQKLSVSEALGALEAQGVPCAPVREIPEVVTDPNLLSDEAIIPIFHPKWGKVDGAKAASLPIEFSLSPTGFDRPAPVLGQDNETIYGKILGLDASRIQELRNKGII
ncbi:MAG: hypothetical protein GX550_05380, partial [Syntrophomonadaceae bacterium]|nr:hypothetical protein [Syntrophomonadaceae bacterium]